MNMTATLLGTGKKIVCGMLLTLMLTVAAFSSIPAHHTQAFGGDIVFDPTNFVKNTITSVQSGVTSFLQSQLNIKEFTLDQIAFSLAKKVLAQTTRSLVDWINTGFEGKPAFITNLDDYLLNAADEAVGGFLQQSNFAFVCKPMQIPIRVILHNYYIKSRDWEPSAECTLSEAVDNINGLATDVQSGGLSRWFETFSVPQNNIYGLSAIGAARINTVAESSQKNAQSEADWSNGWLSVKDCSTGKCITVTPGNVISEYLNFKLTVGDRTLIEADEINEIVGALFNQLGNQAIMGMGGLLGLSYSSDGVSPSYLDSFGAEIDQMGAGVGDSNFILDAIRIETQYKAMYEKGLEDLENIADTLESCSGASAESVLEDLASTTLDYTEEVDTAAQILAILSLLKEEFDAATDVELKQVVTDTFIQLQREGIMHTASDLELAKQDIAREVVDLEGRADRLSCPSN